MSPAPVTADLFARAIIASALNFGDDPLRACEIGRGVARRSLAPAVFGLAYVTRAQLQDLCRPLGLRADNVARAQKVGGARFAKAQAAAQEAVEYHLRGLELQARAPAPAAPILEAVEPGGCAPPVYVERPAPAKPNTELRNPAGETIPSRQGGARAAEAVTGDAPVASAPTITPAPQPPPRRPPLKGPPIGRAMPKGVRLVNLGEGVQRIEMKPVPERVARMAKQQLDRGADLAFVADCFDVDEAALQAAVEALNPGAAA